MCSFPLFPLYRGDRCSYTIVTPPMFRVYAVAMGDSKPYATIANDSATMLRMITAAQMCFYTLLYSVKLSLLTLYRKLLEGLPAVYKRVWWGIIGFCILAWIGSAVSSLTTCNDLKAKFSRGKCMDTPNEAQRVIFSLYFAYGLDVVTDIAVMLLPLRLVWNLRLKLGQKVGIVALFASGLICIVFATIRVVELGVSDGKAATPQPKWLILWTVLETSAAIMIGCAPTFAVFLRTQMSTKKSTDLPSGDNLKMKSNISTPARGARASHPYWEVEHSSQEELAKDTGHVATGTLQ
ncbi:hypothetical protein P280DRAFT_399230 [Massarina eburnea CBS 473.64]|uniref:Rhodopsin domain-containing protein n=1 Tax=Massarina eburnea CBS 473.64 TaxID=1395130 RepID=A0A6A6S2L8_9PLEO|nr:hypothetical protein P280DRAFT_399230 [Massarina eburnea CBS 473.64]